MKLDLVKPLLSGLSELKEHTQLQRGPAGVLLKYPVTFSDLLIGVVSLFLAFSLGSSAVAEEPVHSGGRAVPGREGCPGLLCHLRLAFPAARAGKAAGALLPV